MDPPWQDVGCASIPVQDLPVLADLRGRAEIRVTVVGDQAWIHWEPGPSPLLRALVMRLLPLPGVELYTRRGEWWYRPGRHLPAFEVPVADRSEGVPLEQVILPKPMAALRPSGAAPHPHPLRLVRDPRCEPRSAGALLCRLDRLAAWAERATSVRLAALRAAWTGGAEDGPGEARVLVLGAPGSLPELPDGPRFWGGDLLIPLGFRPDPELPEPALRHAVGAGPDDLVVLDGEGYELIPRAVFRPLSRAGIRLARGGMMPGPPRGGRRP